MCKISRTLASQIGLLIRNRLRNIMTVKLTVKNNQNTESQVKDQLDLNIQIPVNGSKVLTTRFTRQKISKPSVAISMSFPSS